MRQLAISATLCLGAAVAACGTDPLGLYQREVTNTQDFFKYENPIALAGITRTETFDWPNSGTAADITGVSGPQEGQARLVILDADGSEVYGGALSSGLDATTAAGTAGSWTIELTLTGVSGTLEFTVETPVATAYAGP